MTPDEKWRLLNCQRLPARLSVEETAVLLGVSAHDIPILIGAGCLKPLGQPAANAPKKFAAVDVENLRLDRQWLTKATVVITRAWAKKNRRAKLLRSPRTFADEHFSTPAVA